MGVFQVRVKAVGQLAHVLPPGQAEALLEYSREVSVKEILVALGVEHFHPTVLVEGRRVGVDALISRDCTIYLILPAAGG